MPSQQKKRGRGRPRKAEAVPPPTKRKRNSCEGAVEAGTPDNNPNTTGNDEEPVTLPPTKRRRGRSPKKSGQNGGETDQSKGSNGVNGKDCVKEEFEEEAKKEEEISCPNCNKTFKSQQGLKYHLGEFFTLRIFMLCDR